MTKLTNRFNKVKTIDEKNHHSAVLGEVERVTSKSKSEKPREFAPMKDQFKMSKDFDRADEEIEKMFFGED